MSSNLNPPTETPIVLTITIKPIKGGKRMIIVSGAPQDEMPSIKTGQFAERHALLDAVYFELLKRKPQQVKKPKPSDDAKAAPRDAEPLASEESEAEGEATTPADSEAPSSPAAREFEQTVMRLTNEGDQLVASGETSVSVDEASENPTAPDDESSALPLIEGDPNPA